MFPSKCSYKAAARSYRLVKVCSQPGVTHRGARVPQEHPVIRRSSRDGTSFWPPPGGGAHACFFAFPMLDGSGRFRAEDQEPGLRAAMAPWARRNSFIILPCLHDGERGALGCRSSESVAHLIDLLGPLLRCPDPRIQFAALLYGLPREQAVAIVTVRLPLWHSR
jgi:hypothetical protein